MPLPDKETRPVNIKSPLEIFIDTVCIKASGSAVSAKEFYESYSNWCLCNGHRAEGETVTARNLHFLGIKSAMAPSHGSYRRLLQGIDLPPVENPRPSTANTSHLDALGNATIEILTDLHTRIHQHTPMQPAALELATNVQQMLTGSMAAHAAVVKSVELDELHGDKAAALDRALVASAASAILALIVLREGTAKTGGIN